MGTRVYGRAGLGPLPSLICPRTGRVSAGLLPPALPSPLSTPLTLSFLASSSRLSAQNPTQSGPDRAWCRRCALGDT